MAALISTVDPPQGRPGDVVAINGTGFPTVPEQVRVSFETIPALVISSSATQVVAVAPAGLTEDFQVYVEVLNLDDVTNSQRAWFVRKPVADYATEELAAQQPGILEVVPPPLYLERPSVPEAKDHERIVGHLRSWFRELFPSSSSGRGASLFGADSDLLPSLAPSSPDVQAALEAVSVAAATTGRGLGVDTSTDVQAATGDELIKRMRIPANTLREDGEFIEFQFRFSVAGGILTGTVTPYLDGTSIGNYGPVSIVYTGIGGQVRIGDGIIEGIVLRKDATHAFASTRGRFYKTSSPVGPRIQRAYVLPSRLDPSAGLTVDWTQELFLDLILRGGSPTNRLTVDLAELELFRFARPGFSYSRTAADSVDLGEALLVEPGTHNRSAADVIAAIADSLLVENSTDHLGAVDSATTELEYARALADALGVVDDVFLGLAAADELSIVDLVELVRDSVRFASDAVAVSDQVAVTFPFVSVVLSDSVAIADAVEGLIPIVAGDTFWSGSEANKLYRQSSQFSTTLKDSVSVGAVDANVRGPSWDWNTPWAGTAEDKLYIQSGFTSTLLSSLSVSGSDTAPESVSSTGSMDTVWVGRATDKLFLQSGRFSGTVKSSRGIGFIDDQPRGVSFDNGGDIPWTGTTGQRLYHQSGFTTTLKTSQAVGSIDTTPTGISWDSINTPWCGEEAGKLYLTSGQFTSTVKRSLSIASVDANPQGIEAGNFGDRIGHLIEPDAADAVAATDSAQAVLE